MVDGAEHPGAEAPPVVARQLTEEQLSAIERRDGALMLSAGAGSGKTTVLVSRFVASVLEDEIDVERIVAITFTEKAAAELSDRVQVALRTAGRADLAVRAQAAWISTIHGFCARILRAQALSAGLDPEFTVLDETDRAALREEAYDLALRELARTEEGARLIASYSPAALRSATLATYDELRARGQHDPRLPDPPPPVDLDRHRAMLQNAAQMALAELDVADPGVQVSKALDTLRQVPSALEEDLPWPGDLTGLELKGTAKALKSEACANYRDALDHYKTDLSREYACRLRPSLQRLLELFGEHFSAAKRARSALDFEDLELEALRLLANDSVAASYRERFVRVMVDEMQDTNAVQHQLIDRIATGRLFMVGDAQQSIYGFRHADVELFTRRGRELADSGAHQTLKTNFRTRQPILNLINCAFEEPLGDSFMALEAGREAPAASAEPADGPSVELIIADQTIEEWRLAEANALAARIKQLTDSGEVRGGEVVILMRAGTDMALYERALAAVELGAQVVGGRGFWEQPQVLTLTSYLRSLANPLDEQSYYATLLSPIGGVALDTAVLLAAEARGEIEPDERQLLEQFEAWFANQRRKSVQAGVEQLLLDALTHRDHGDGIAAMPNGARRLANVRKLRGIARQWEAGHGSDLHGFVNSLRLRASGEGGREAEASASVDVSDSVRLMTIHSAKGLEFPVVCVADLGRRRNSPTKPIVQLDRAGERIGLLIGQPGSMKPVETAEYQELAEAQAEREAAEQRRLFYVAVTRARDRLILSGGAELDGDFGQKNKLTPIGWLAPAFVPQIASLASAERETNTGPTVSSGVAVSFVGEPKPEDSVPGDAAQPTPAPATDGELASAPHATEPDSHHPTPTPTQTGPPTPTRVSYSSIAAYERCPYRYYLERILGLETAAAATEDDASVKAGLAVHAALRHSTPNWAADPGRELKPDSDLDPELIAAITAFQASPTAARLAKATNVYREKPFVFELDGQLISGVFDVLAQEPDGGLLIIDYKSDHLDPTQTPAGLVAERYATQRDLYALAALLAGAGAVQVQYVFLRSTDEPVTAEFGPEDRPALLQKLRSRLAGQRAGQYPVSDRPGARVCRGCVGAGGLCSHPPQLTGR